MEILAIGAVALIAIGFSETVAPKLRIASPLFLVILGIGISLLPFVPDVEIDPHWILAGVLPPLLYAAAVSLPAMDFRRDIQAISGLSILLVIISTAALGFLFHLLIPGMALPLAFALGAIVSPTDAVAASIVKHVGVSPRLTGMLEGESLLNDATALALLRSAIAVAVIDYATISAGSIAWDFVRSLFIAVLWGWFIGWLNLRIRSRITEAPVNTILSFTVPFVASIPAELANASGLVAAVVAGLITGHGAPRFLTPANRASDTRTWRAISLALEGSVFLIMGLEMEAILHDLVNESLIWVGIRVGLIGLGAILLIRAAYVSVLLAQLHHTLKVAKKQLEKARADEDYEANALVHRALPAPIMTTNPKRRRLIRERDIAYLESSPMGWREGAILTWGGMRGVVTLVAAQTIPTTVAHRPLIIFIAFVVAATSLLVQGGTLGLLVKWLRPHQVDEEELAQQRIELRGDLNEVTLKSLEAVGITQEALRGVREVVAEAVTHGDGETPDEEQIRTMRIKMIKAQRGELLRARAEARYSSEVLAHALHALDTEQIALESRGAD